MNIEIPQNSAPQPQEAEVRLERNAVNLAMIKILDKFITSLDLPDESKDELRIKLTGLNVALKDVFDEIDRISQGIRI